MKRSSLDLLISSASFITTSSPIRTGSSSTKTFSSGTCGTIGPTITHPVGCVLSLPTITSRVIHSRDISCALQRKFYQRQLSQLFLYAFFHFRFHSRTVFNQKFRRDLDNFCSAPAGFTYKINPWLKLIDLVQILRENFLQNAEWESYVRFLHSDIVGHNSMLSDDIKPLLKGSENSYGQKRSAYSTEFKSDLSGNVQHPFQLLM